MRRALLLLLLLSACASATPTATDTPLPLAEVPGVDSNSPRPESGEGPGVRAPTPGLELESAIEQARATLDEFSARIQTPSPTRTFAALKVRFTHTDRTVEFIWVDNVTYENGVFRGLVGDDLPDLGLSAGDPVKVKGEDIVDWMIVEDGKLIGGYTIRLAYSRMTPEERQRFLDESGYSLDE